MPTGSEALAVMSALPEPAILSDARGRVLHANRAAAKVFGRAIAGSDLADFCGDPKPLLTLLERASGSREPLPGSFLPRPETGVPRHRVHASVVRPATPAKRPVISDASAASLMAPSLSCRSLQARR